MNQSKVHHFFSVTLTFLLMICAFTNPTNGEIIALNEDNIDLVLKSHELVFIVFYGSNTSTLMEWYNSEAQKILYEIFPQNAGRVVLAAVDCSRSFGVCRRYNKYNNIIYPAIRAVKDFGRGQVLPSTFLDSTGITLFFKQQLKRLESETDFYGSGGSGLSGDSSEQEELSTSTHDETEDVILNPKTNLLDDGIIHEQLNKSKIAFDESLKSTPRDDLHFGIQNSTTHNYFRDITTDENDESNKESEIGSENPRTSSAEGNETVSYSSANINIASFVNCVLLIIYYCNV